MRTAAKQRMLSRVLRELDRMETHSVERQDPEGIEHAVIARLAVEHWATRDESLDNDELAEAVCA